MAEGLVLGLDLAQKTGWALLDGAGDRVDSGWWDFRRKRGESESFTYIQFRKVLRLSLINERKRPEMVFYEDVQRHAGTFAAHAYGAFRIAMMEVLDAEDIPYKGLGVKAVKKHATGNGNAGKPAMMEAAKARWGLSSVLEDEADALWIADTGLAESWEEEQCN